MQEEIRQKRACDSPLRGAFRPLKEGTVRTLNRGTQPPPDIELYPGKISVVRDGLLDQIMRDRIKGSRLTLPTSETSADQRQSYVRGIRLRAARCRSWAR